MRLAPVPPHDGQARLASMRRVPLVGGPTVAEYPREEHPSDCQFPEILVEGQQDAALLVRIRENRTVARILRPVSTPFHVVPFGRQGLFQLARNAGIKQKPQAAVRAMRGSTRSCSTIRCA